MISRKISILASFLLLMFSTMSVSCSPNEKQADVPPPNSYRMNNPQTTDTAYLAGGCYWCIEAVFQRLEGVVSVESGFAGGSVKNPSYKAVCEGTTGHAELCKIVFDPHVVTYEELLYVFFSTHDPTTLNRQGNDVGTQYRSAIFTISDEQLKIAKNYVEQLEASKTWENTIVTEIKPLDVYYPAEDYHQNYYNQNSSQSYCAFVVRPKVEKFLSKFHDRVKKEYKE